MSTSETCLVVAPHPDDETIGCAIWMKRRGLRDAVLLHVTDGSPRDPRFARAAGFSSRETYAIVRHRELEKALQILGLPLRQCLQLGFTDLEVSNHLPDLIARITRFIELLGPSTVLTPAYEGGHPDHDATAFALAVVRKRIQLRFRHREYRLYHAGHCGLLVVDQFLPAANGCSEILHLTPEERALKASMVACFSSQRDVLSVFGLEDEQFRDAPLYDFTQPPHEGLLQYERWNLGVSGDEWRAKAMECL